MSNPIFSNYSKEELIQLLEIYAKGWLAMDGLWFQSVEQKNGMGEAMYHDTEAWRRFTVIEARRIKSFLKLSETPGIEGLKQALQLRLCATLNEYSIETTDDTLIYTCKSCRVQNARSRKGMPLHPCKSVGIIEYGEFAKFIDARFSCECISCYPEITDDSCCCSWKFTLKENS